MDSFQSFNGQFNPQIYESSNVPPSTDRLFSFSGFQAGLMTSQTSTSNSTSNQHHFLQQQHIMNQQPLLQPTIPTQATIVSGPPPPSLPNATLSDHGRYSGMYANTGFDMLSLLSRVVNR